MHSDYESATTVAHTGAASRGNPGPAGAGVLLLRLDGRIYLKLYRYLGCQTANEAEYHALLLALRRALERGFRRIVIRSSSELMVNQLAGRYSVKSANLQLLHRLALVQLRRFEAWDAEHVPRQRNNEAHRLANKAIELHAPERQQVDTTPIANRP